MQSVRFISQPARVLLGLLCLFAGCDDGDPSASTRDGGPLDGGSLDGGALDAADIDADPEADGSTPDAGDDGAAFACVEDEDCLSMRCEARRCVTYDVVYWAVTNATTFEPVVLPLGPVASVVASDNGFAALLADGRVAAWSSNSVDTSAVPSDAVQAELNADVVGLYAGPSAFVATRRDGTLVAWGPSDRGGHLGALAGQAIAPRRLWSNPSAFVVESGAGTWLAWGSGGSGRLPAEISATLAAQGVAEIVASAGAFAALTLTGQVLTWGGDRAGGDSSALADRLAMGVEAIVAGGDGFAARLADGTVAAWRAGRVARVVGLDDPTLSPVTGLAAHRGAYAAWRADGTTTRWGEEVDAPRADEAARLVDVSRVIVRVRSTEVPEFVYVIGDRDLLFETDGEEQYAGPIEDVILFGTQGRIVLWRGADDAVNAKVAASGLRPSTDLTDVHSVAWSQSAYGIGNRQAAVLLNDGRVRIFSNDQDDAGPIEAMLTERVEEVVANPGGFVALRRRATQPSE